MTSTDKVWRGRGQGNYLVARVFSHGSLNLRRHAGIDVFVSKTKVHFNLNENAAKTEVVGLQDRQKQGLVYEETGCIIH